jgi:hypothetical protein
MFALLEYLEADARANIDTSEAVCIIHQIYIVLMKNTKPMVK